MGMEMLAQIFEIIILPLISILAGYAVKFISVKIKELSDSRNNTLEKNI
jgi:hypothetical protein